MLEKTVLEIIFKDESNKNLKISVDSAKENIEKMEVQAFSEFVIDNSIFHTKNGVVNSMKNAYVKTTKIEEIM